MLPEKLKYSERACSSEDHFRNSLPIQPWFFCFRPWTVRNEKFCLMIQSYQLTLNHCHFGSATLIFPVCRIRIYSIRIWIRIRIQHFRLNSDPDPGFWWTKIWKNLQLKKKLNFQIKLQLTHPLDSIKDIQATEEAFSPQKRTSSTSRHKIS
jgi:hypothetical protein